MKIRFPTNYKLYQNKNTNNLNNKFSRKYLKENTCIPVNLKMAQFRHENNGNFHRKIYNYHQENMGMESFPCVLD